ncbi:hypothetical protein [Calidifontibacillus erzurumensis]|uniref:hypothetical protein n=1 Tax=Calidifontibacillus erzurumensis TaxID=2741433 RepID=UPI0035B53C2C
MSKNQKNENHKEDEKNMLKKLAIWYLRKKKCSVLIGYKLSGGQIKALNKDAYTYNNVFDNVDYRLSNDKPYKIPEGKFQVKLKD